MLTDLYGRILVASLSNLYHMNSTVKSACLVDCYISSLIWLKAVEVQTKITSNTLMVH